MELVKRLREWIRYRNLSHFEIRWRPPGERGWQQIDDGDDQFDPSDLETPISESSFHTHARVAEWYQGEYRLVGIDDQGRIDQTVWQTWFEDGPSLREEQRRERQQQERMQEFIRLTEQMLEEISSSDRY